MAEGRNYVEPLMAGGSKLEPDKECPLMEYEPGMSKDSNEWRDTSKGATEDHGSEDSDSSGEEVPPNSPTGSESDGGSETSLGSSSTLEYWSDPNERDGEVGLPVQQDSVLKRSNVESSVRPEGPMFKVKSPYARALKERSRKYTEKERRAKIIQGQLSLNRWVRKKQREKICIQKMFDQNFLTFMKCGFGGAG